MALRTGACDFAVAAGRASHAGATDQPASSPRGRLGDQPWSRPPRPSPGCRQSPSRNPARCLGGPAATQARPSRSPVTRECRLTGNPCRSDAILRSAGGPAGDESRLTGNPCRSDAILRLVPVGDQCQFTAGGWRWIAIACSPDRPAGDECQFTAGGWRWIAMALRGPGPGAAAVWVRDEWRFTSDIRGPLPNYVGWPASQPGHPRGYASAGVGRQWGSGVSGRLW
jgi:hypothetical protein